MIHRTVLVLVSLAISCNAFWWSTQQTQPEPQQQTLKQVPVGYFRTYTYQPLAYHAPKYSPYSVTGSRMPTYSLPYGSWQRQMSIPQTMTQAASNLSPSQPIATAASPLPPQTTIMATTIYPSSSQSTQTPSSTSDPPTTISTTTTTTTTTETPTPETESPKSTLYSHPLPQSLSQMESQSITKQFSSLPKSPGPPSSSQYGMPSDPLQYMAPNTQPITVQHIQYVPCMCPVTVTVSGNPDMISDRRSSSDITNDIASDSISILSADDI